MNHLMLHFRNCERKAGSGTLTYNIDVGASRHERVISLKIITGINEIKHK